MLTSWNCPGPDGSKREEFAVSFDKRRDRRLLVLPALFDEANKLRRFTVEVMRRLDLSGIDSFLPDLPGCNESTLPLAGVTLHDWRKAATAAAEEFGATHVLSLRGGALICPDALQGWHFSPVTGAKLLRAMLRAHTIVAREQGQTETLAQLQEKARIEGLTLSGWEMSAAMFRELEAANPSSSERQEDIDQSMLGGAGLWLRAEPDYDPQQADALAATIVSGLTLHR